MPTISGAGCKPRTTPAASCTYHRPRQPRRARRIGELKNLDNTRYQTFLPRIAARLIDGALLVIAVGVTTELSRRTIDPLWAYAPIILTLYLVPLAYFAITTRAWGATPGKQLLGLKVCAVTNAQSLSGWRAFTRELPLGAMTLVWTGILGYLLFDCPGATRHEDTLSSVLAGAVLFTAGWWFLGILAAGASPRTRTLHDLLAGSVVVRTRDISNPLDPLAPEPPPSAYPADLEFPHLAPETR
ncbi:MAG: RDD family protein [Tepidiformaceae bacterium]